MSHTWKQGYTPNAGSSDRIRGITMKSHRDRCISEGTYLSYLDWKFPKCYVIRWLITFEGVGREILEEEEKATIVGNNYPLSVGDLEWGLAENKGANLRKEGA